MNFCDGAQVNDILYTVFPLKIIRGAKFFRRNMVHNIMHSKFKQSVRY